MMRASKVFLLLGCFSFYLLTRTLDVKSSNFRAVIRFVFSMAVSNSNYFCPIFLNISNKYGDLEINSIPYDGMHSWKTKVNYFVTNCDLQVNS